MSGSNDFKPTSRAKLEADNRALIIRIRELERKSYEPQTESEMALAGMAHILSVHRGYWRLGQSLDGVYWVRWKWTAPAPLAERYTFATATALDVAVLEAVENVLACEAGKRVAHLDKGARR